MQHVLDDALAKRFTNEDVARKCACMHNSTQAVEENSHQILKLAGRRIQDLLSTYGKLTVQPATQAENGPRDVQIIPHMYHGQSLSVHIWK